MATTPRRPHSAELDGKIKVLAMEGRTALEIAIRVGFSRRTVSYRLGKLMREGAIPQAKLRRVATLNGNYALRRLREKTGIKSGVMADIMGMLTDKEIGWVVKNVPLDSTLATFLAMLVRDAVAEENGDD